MVCGAIADRSVILERAVDEFARKYVESIIQASACTLVASPLMVQMSWGWP
jgi:hypothetical protein